MLPFIFYSDSELQLQIHSSHISLQRSKWGGRGANALISLRFAGIFEDFLGIRCKMKKEEFCRQIEELVPPVQNERHIQMQRFKC